MGTEGTIRIFGEAEAVLGSWGKKGPKWQGVRARVLAEQLLQALQLLGAAQGKKSGPLFKSNIHLKRKQPGHV